MRKKVDFSDFEQRLVVSTRWAGILVFFLEWSRKEEKSSMQYVVERENVQQRCATDKPAATVGCYHCNIVITNKISFIQFNFNQFSYGDE